jgi:YQGE family putative transporter
MLEKKNHISRLINLPSLSRDFKILCLYQLVLHLMDGMLGLFLPIFLFESLRQNIYLVVIFYIVGYALYGLLVPLGAMAMSRIGLKKSMIIARLMAVLFYVSLLYFKRDPLLFSILANIILLIFRLLYWIPYHTNFAQITHHDTRGRQVAYFAVIGYLASIAAPLLAGLLLSQYSFNLLFIITMITFGLSAIPLVFLSPATAHFEYSFFGTFKEWAKKANQRLRIAYMADGSQDLVGVIIWPIFIYQLLNKEYLAVGAVSSLIVVGTIICYLITGQYADKLEKKKLMRLGSSFYALGWLLKTFVITAFQIFVVGTLHAFAAILLRTPFDALMYERTADHGSYVDEYTVLRDMSINFGRVLMGILLIILISVVGLKIAFPLAAVVSLLVNLL